MCPAIENQQEPVNGVVSRMMRIASFPVDDRALLIRTVRRSLADRSPRVRSAALDVVGKQLLGEVEETVLDLLADRTSYVRYSAVECIGSLREGQAICASYLYPLLRDPDSMVRIETLESLSQIGDRRSLPLIAELLRDEDPLVRGYAATAIEDLDGTKYVPAIKSARSTEEDDGAKVRFASALFYFGDATQFPVILGFLMCDVYQVRCAAANILNSFELNAVQLQSALAAVAHAARNSLFRADRTTMDRVLTKLLESVS